MTIPKDNALHLMEGQGLLEVARLLVAFDFKSDVPLGDIQAMARTAIAAHESFRRCNMKGRDSDSEGHRERCMNFPHYDDQPVAFALKWPDDERLNLSTVFDTEEEAINYMEQCSDGVVVVPLFAAPKTSFDHWVDEVEASGEAEKHAVELDRQRVSGKLSYTLRDDAGDTRIGNYPITADQFNAIAAILEGSGDFKALYEKSQELFARERGITKDQGQYIEELFSALDRLHHSYQMILSRKPVRDVEETLAEVAAALSKVQHVAARGAEVSE